MIRWAGGNDKGEKVLRPVCDVGAKARGVLMTIWTAWHGFCCEYDWQGLENGACCHCGIQRGVVERDEDGIVIRVMYRWKVRPGAEDVFVQAWTRGTQAIQATFKGARGSFLLRDQLNPQEFIGIACWDCVEDCQVFWRSPRPDPEAARVVAAVSTRVSRLMFDEVQDVPLGLTVPQVGMPTAA